MSIAARIIESAEKVKAKEGRYPTMFIPREEFDALLVECNAKSNGMPVKLRGIKVVAFDVETAGSWEWKQNVHQTRNGTVFRFNNARS